MKHKKEANLIQQLWEDKLGKKCIIAGGILIGLYGSTYLMNGASKVIYSYKNLVKAIK